MRRALLATIVAVALGVAAGRAEGSVASPTSASTSRSVVTQSAANDERWVRVAVATVWVRPALTRPVDRFVVTSPVLTRSWVGAMTLAQKRWLVGRIETQVLYGTRVLVTARAGAWSHILIPSQPTPRDGRGYPGWIPTWQLTATPPRATGSVAVVTARTTWLSSAKDAGAGWRVMELSYDTRLPVVSAGAAWVEVSLLDGHDGYLRTSAVALRARPYPALATGARVVAEARRFLGLGYLWGGTSSFGYDCSGFTYSVYHQLGVTIPRDAAPQGTRGTRVARSALRPGDLVFFRGGTGPIVHVAIFYGSVHGVPSVIHAPDTGQSVTITPLSAWPSSSYAGARRYVAP